MKRSLVKASSKYDALPSHSTHSLNKIWNSLSNDPFKEGFYWYNLSLMQRLFDLDVILPQAGEEIPSRDISTPSCPGNPHKLPST